jgi:hypothetical protein
MIPPRLTSIGPAVEQKISVELRRITEPVRFRNRDSKRLVRAPGAVAYVSSAGDSARALPITLTATTDIPIANLINRMVISQIG